MGVFVGRTRELETLGEVAASASRGPAAAIVIGEPGSGKSRLLAEAQGRAQLRHRLAITGYEPEHHVPLAAATPLLRALTEVPGHGARLEALLFPPDEVSALEPVRLFEAAHRALRTLEPALVVIDDLQWMDELSYALCYYLIRAARDSGQQVAIFTASRPRNGGQALTDALPASEWFASTSRRWRSRRASSSRGRSIPGYILPSPGSCGREPRDLVIDRGPSSPHGARGPARRGRRSDRRLRCRLQPRSRSRWEALEVCGRRPGSSAQVGAV